MWTLIPILLMVYDYMKDPIDRLYFTNPIRPFVGMCNTFMDFFVYPSKPHFQRVWLLNVYFPWIRRVFMEQTGTVKKHMFHDLDPWFDVNTAYTYQKVEDFPELKRFIDTIPCIHPETAVFAIMDGPVRIPPHRAESNWLLRYHLTIQSEPGDCTLYTSAGAHDHVEGESFIFDHSRYHEVTKHGPNRRVVLILDIKRL